MSKIGLLICGSNASNTGALTSMTALEIIEESPEVGKLIMMDGYHNECTKKYQNRIKRRQGNENTACLTANR